LKGLWWQTGSQIGVIVLLTNQEVLFRMVVSLAIGLIIGFERTIHQKPAGIRTYSLVCIGSTMFMIVSAYGIQVVPLGNLLHAGDPGRVAAQIITGIGFLGAGVILHDRGRIRGLTTAAEMWTTAGLGMAVGLGLYFLALVSVVCVEFALYSHYFFCRLGVLSHKDGEEGTSGCKGR
jgi:putative Mg2+ transporter-C (MgtC) family protein